MGARSRRSVQSTHAAVCYCGERATRSTKTHVPWARTVFAPFRCTSLEWASMNILGISGLERSMPFKRAQWPGLGEREYRISQGHDSAAVLVIDGEAVAAVAEERLTRRKHTGDFPKHAIAACLAQAGISLRDVDELVHSFDYQPYRGVYA